MYVKGATEMRHRSTSFERPQQSAFQPFNRQKTNPSASSGTYLTGEGSATANEAKTTISPSKMLKFSSGQNERHSLAVNRIMDDGHQESSSEESPDERVMPTQHATKKYEQLQTSGGKMMNTVHEFSGEFNQREKMQKQSMNHYGQY